MTYDEGLAGRIRTAVEAAAGPAGCREITMFGGLCWTVNTHMAVGTGDDDLTAVQRHGRCPRRRRSRRVAPRRAPTSPVGAARRRARRDQKR